MADLINRHPDRFLFGTDEVAPTDQAKYLKVYDMYAPLFAKLTPEASEKLRKGNYERLFDAARLQGAGLGEGEPEVNEEETVRRNTSDARGTAGCRLAARGVAGRRGASGSGGVDRAAGPRAGPDADARGRARAGHRSQARGEAAHGHLRLRDARHGLRVRSRTIPTGSTCCGRPSCRPSTTSSARTATSSPASARAASA